MVVTWKRPSPAIVRRLNPEIAKVLADPETNKPLTNQAMQTVGNAPEAFAATAKATAE